MPEINKQIRNKYQISPEDLEARSAFKAALARVLSDNLEAINFIKPDRGDSIGISGGEELTLYPDPEDSRAKITIRPVGRTAEDRRFPADSVHLVYKGTGDAIGTYRIHRDDGAGAVERWVPHPQINGAIDSEPPPADIYLALTEALSGATTEKPTSQFRKRVAMLIGNKSRKA